MQRLIDLARLPTPVALETLDFEAVLAALVNDFRTRWPQFTAVLESDPAVKLLEVAAWRETLLRARVNDAYKAAMLAFASGSDLDHVGAFHGVARNVAEADAAYRERVQQGYWRVAAAGPAAAFVAHARGAHAQVVDAEAWTAAPGSVQLAVLAAVEVPDAGLLDADRERNRALASGVFATLPAIAAGFWWGCAAMLDEPMRAVRSAVTADAVLPLGMEIGVRPAELVEFRTAARLVLYPGVDEAMALAQARQRLADHLQAVARLNHDVTRAGLIAALAVPGVQNVHLDTPVADVVCGHGQLALSLSADVAVEAIRDV